jgi:thioredoxin reductase
LFDVIIVGAGPAGLSAALCLGRCRRHVLICDSGRPRNAFSHSIHGFLTCEGIEPAEFLRLGREQLRLYPTVEYRSITVMDATRDTSSFTVTLADHRCERSRALLLATGVVDELPPIAGIEKFFGRSVFHCPFCHGWEVRDQPLAVYGSGKQGWELTLQLLPWSRDLVLCTDGPSGLDIRERAILMSRHIVLQEERLAGLRGTNGQVEQILFATGEVLTRRALFFRAKTHEQTELAAKLGYDESSEEEPQRVAPGLYLAGDVAGSHWVTGAVADGADVAIAIHADLFREELGKGGLYSPSSLPEASSLRTGMNL